MTNWINPLEVASNPKETWLTQMHLHSCCMASQCFPTILKLHICMRKESIRDQNITKINSASQPPAMIKPLFSTFCKGKGVLPGDSRVEWPALLPWMGVLSCSPQSTSLQSTYRVSPHLSDACKHTAIPWLFPPPQISRYRDFFIFIFHHFLVQTELETTALCFYI